MYDKSSLEEILRIVFESELQNKIHKEDIEFIDKLKKVILEKVQSQTDFTNEKIEDLTNYIENTEITVELTIKDCGILLVKMERLLKLERQRIGLEKLLQSYIDRDKKAFEVYHKPTNTRQRKRLRDVAVIYGLTDGSGKRQSKINKSAMFWDYMELITGKLNNETFKVEKPISKWDAIRTIKEKYEISSDQAVLTHLKREIAKRKKQSRDSGFTGGFDGLLPSNWPEV